MGIITSNSCHPCLRAEPENESTNSRHLNQIFNEAEQRGKRQLSCLRRWYQAEPGHEFESLKATLSMIEDIFLV